MEADDADKVISVFHFSKELARTHGVPFRFVLKPVRSSFTVNVPRIHASIQGEKFSETKKRLQKRMNIPDKDFVRYRASLIQVATFKQPSAIEDGECLTIIRQL